LSGAIPEESMRDLRKSVKNLTKIRQVSAALKFRGGSPIFEGGPHNPCRYPAVMACRGSPPPLRLVDREALLQAGCQVEAAHTIAWKHVGYVNLPQVHSQLLESKDLAGDPKSSPDRISAKPRPA
jgi:hypothetical protein